ncbi:MAG: ABC-F type ribosomal protection protein [Clostridia bacterium]|nr:ABC-F type ribosomal protection protein [Clostridia bacterium]
MARIQISHLTFAYDGSPDLIFDDASFQIDTDWKLGFVGRNGRGKTTLLRILMGELDGHGAVSSPVALDYFPFPIKTPDSTPLDIAANMDPDGQIWRFMKEIACLDVADDVLARPFATLSGGEQAKVLLAALFAQEHHFLLIDEPTNHLDLAGRQVVSRYLNGKKGFILVSHDRAFLDGCVDHILSINRATIDVQKGNFSSWEENKRRQDQFELEKNEHLKQDIRKLKEAARRIASWSDAVEETKIGHGACDRGAIGAKAAKMMRHSKAVETRRNREIEEKEKLLKNIEKSDDLKIFPQRHPVSRLAECREVNIAYDGRTILSSLSFEIHNGDILALTGPNGCGKSSVLKLLSGEIAPSSGTARLASGLVLSIVPQQAVLTGSLRDFIQENSIDETLFKTILRKLDFKREQFEKDMASFSAGQKKKVLIARSLCQSAHLYLWDEPLNYIDVLSRMQIERLIAQFHPTMVLVEHDQAFIDHTATRTLALKGER